MYSLYMKAKAMGPGLLLKVLSTEDFSGVLWVNAHIFYKGR